MASFDILVHVRRLDGESHATSVAFALAQRLGAHVSGLYVAPFGSMVARNVS